MRGLVALGAAAVLLAGCTSDPAPPATLPPLTTSPTPSPTPGPTPTGINAPDAFGASAFTKHWFASLNAAFASGSTETLKSLTDAACESCANLIAGIEDIARKGNRIEGLTYELLVAEASPPEQGKALVDVAWQISASVEYDAAGRVVDRGKRSGRLRGQMLLARVEPSWSVIGFRATSP